MDKNKVFESLEDINFVFESGNINAFGHRFINNQRFKESMNRTKEQLSLQLKKANEIKNNEEAIMKKAEENASELLQNTEDYIKNMDTVLEAKKIAQSIIDAAKEEALVMIKEAEETKEKSIEYGEKVKSRLINQGYEFLETKISSAINAVEQSRNHIDNLKNELHTAYEEVSSSLSVDDINNNNLEKKNA
jgi:hypothetical protein